MKSFSDNLSDFKRLRGGVVFMDELPLTPSDKISKHALKKLIPVVRKE